MVTLYVLQVQVIIYEGFFSGAGILFFKSTIYCIFSEKKIS